MLSHKALTHLKKRYTSVLKKCSLLNGCGTLAKAVSLSVGIVSGVMAWGTITSYAASVDYTATAGYTDEAAKNSNFIDLINVKNAYDQGYTGASITVGVIDSPIQTSHSELLGKSWAVDTYYNGELYEPNWTYDGHGSHVAGIVAAKRDGKGMHGVAYDASIRGLAVMGTDDAGVVFSIPSTPAAFASAFDGVRIINNSWGSYWYPYNVSTGHDTTVDAMVAELKKDPNNVFTLLVDYALEHTDTVVVFSAGNDGFSTPSINGMFPRYMGSSLNNWINVSSLDSAYITTDNGSLSVEDGGISIFSGLAAGGERWTVFAPGSSIYSLDAASGGYAAHSGTSMAAPVVSGALALVMQKFPWMTGAQLASTILSTANDNITIDDDYFFQMTTNFDASTGGVSYAITFNHKEGTSYTDAQIKSFLKAAIAKNPVGWAFTGITADNVDYVDISFIVQSIYDATSLESIFGQGVLDVGKAMGGIAELDANRMTAANVQSIAELGTSTNAAKHAIEVLDTKGYTAVFSNDINGFAWDDTYHHAEYKTGAQYGTDADALNSTTGVGKRIGIEKTGDGTLILTGENTYEGATLVTGGILGLMQTNEADSGTLTASDVVVRSGGTFVGDGFVENELINNGIVTPGDFMMPWYSAVYGISNTDTLTVKDYTQSKEGALHICFTNNGNYGKLSTTNANIDGDLRFVPAHDFYENNAAYALNTVLTGTTITGSFATTEVLPTSPALTWFVEDASGYSYKVTVERQDDAYSQYAYNADSRGLGMALAAIANREKLFPLSPDAKNLFTALDFSSTDGGEIQRALSTLSPATYNNQTQTSLSQQASFSDAVFSQMLSTQKQQLALSQAQISANLDKKIANAEEVGVAYLASNDDYLPSLPCLAPAATWEFWTAAIGSYSKQGASSPTSASASSNWSSSSVGLMVGADKLVSDALRLGLHIIATKSSTDFAGNHNARTDSSAFYLGMQGLYTFPHASSHSTSSILDGVYLSGLIRAGFEQNEMQRALYINGYTGYTYSDWMDTSLSAMLAVGKDWNIDKYYFGPFMRLDASYMRRPHITESGSSTRLHIEGDSYISLPLSLGAHMGGHIETFRGQDVYLDLLLAWQTQILNDSYKSTAHFADFSGYNFTTSNETRGKDNFTVQATMKCNASESISLQFNAGTTLYNAKDYDLSGGLTVMWAF